MENDYWYNKDRQLMVDVTHRPVHCRMTLFERPGGFRDTYFLKKEEVEWLLKILPKLVKKMKSERQPPESDAPLSDNGKGDEGD